MKIALLTSKKKFEIIEKKITKKLNDDEVLVKISGTGICGSDLHYFRYGALGTNAQRFPLSLGHETSAEIIDKNKSKFKNYSHVLIDPIDVSKCTTKIIKGMCRCGTKFNLCKHGTYLGASPTPGSFREYLIIKKRQITILNKKIDPKFSSMIEPTGHAYYSVNRANVDYQKQGKALILGSGTIGLLISWILKTKGLKDITILDKNEYRLNLAKKKFGAKNIISQEFEDIKKNNGDPIENNYDYIFDLIVTNSSLDYGLKAVKSGGKYIIDGIPTTDYVSINPHKARTKEINLINVRRSNIEFPVVQNFIIKNSIPINSLVTHYFNLQDIQNGFNIAAEYKDNIIRGVIV